MYTPPIPDLCINNYPDNTTPYCFALTLTLHQTCSRCLTICIFWKPEHKTFSNRLYGYGQERQLLQFQYLKYESACVVFFKELIRVLYYVLCIPNFVKHCLQSLHVCCALQCNVWGVHGEISLSSIGAWTPITGPLFGEILLGANSFDRVSEEWKAWDSSKVYCLSLFSLLNKIPHEKKIF